MLSQEMISELVELLRVCLETVLGVPRGGF